MDEWLRRLLNYLWENNRRGFKDWIMSIYSDTYFGRVEHDKVD